MSDQPRGFVPRLLTRLKNLLMRVNISIVLTSCVAAGLIAVVSSIATKANSASVLWIILQKTWLLFVILSIPYLAARALVWQELLQELGIRVSLRNMVTSFSAGEITKTLPAGIYVQNYLLARLQHFGQYSIMRSSMATTSMLGLEAALALPIALIFGLPRESWVFWSLIGVVIAWLILLGLAWMLVHRWGRDFADKLPDWLNRLRELLEEFLSAGGELIKLKTLRSLLPVAIYMMFYVIELYAIVRAVGLNSVTFTDTMGIYALIVLVNVLVPIPTEIGLTEFTGLGALVAYGATQATAAIVMLGLRILATGMTIVVASVVLLLVRTETIGKRLDALTPLAAPESSEAATST